MRKILLALSILSVIFLIGCKSGERIAFCLDSDSNADSISVDESFYTIGNVQYTQDDGSTATKADSCQGDTLYEQTCEGTTIKTIIHECENGCESSACVR